MKSSLRAAVKRRTHKERSQPSNRNKYGILEKQKDYRLRAKDYRKKEKALSKLWGKAEERNPDEFYFSMQKKNSQGGIHQLNSTPSNRYSQDELKLMLTNDVKYLNLQEQSKAKKLKKVAESLHFIGLPSQSKHTVFVSSMGDAKSFQAEDYFNTPKEVINRKQNRPSNDLLQEASQATISLKAPNHIQKKESNLYSTLKKEMDQQNKISRLREKLDTDKKLKGSGKKRKIPSQVSKGSYSFKWRKERLK